MNLKNKQLTDVVKDLKNASPELVQKAERQIVFDGNNSFKKGCLTVFLSDEVKEVTTTIRGNAVTYPVFAVAYFDEKGEMQGTGTVSINALARRFYPNQDQTSPINAVANFDKYGQTPIEIVRKCIADSLGVNFVKSVPAYAMAWDAVSERSTFEGTIKGDKNTFEIQPIPAAVIAKLEAE